MILLRYAYIIVSFLQGQMLTEFQNIEKFLIFWKNMILQKEYIAMFWLKS